MKARVLMVEDDAALADVLAHNLRHVGFDVQWVANGDAATTAIKSFRPDVILLDLTLPGKSGFELCAAWRAEHKTPIIIVTARDQKKDRLRGLNMGADDYVTKPFDFEELMARLNAVLRRTKPSLDTLTLGSVTVDFMRYTAKGPKGPISLTRREFELLRYLAERPNNIVYRDELLRAVWGYPDAPFTRSVDKAVARLRKKLEPDPHRPVYIHTAHGDGYWLVT